MAIAASAARKQHSMSYRTLPVNYDLRESPAALIYSTGHHVPQAMQRGIILVFSRGSFGRDVPDPVLQEQAVQNDRGARDRVKTAIASCHPDCPKFDGERET
jgi:hypothetical protein